MSYAITPQKDPLLDESTRPVDRRKAAFGAALFTLLLVLSVFMRFFSKQDPLPEPQGVITSFESIEIEPGGGGGSPSKSEEPEPKNETSSSKAKEVETNDDIKSSTSVRSTKNNDANAKVDAGLDFGKSKGVDKSNSNSNSKVTSTLSTTKGTSGGSGYGDGTEVGDGHGLCINNCNCNDKSWDIDIIGVPAYVAVEINEDGSVNSVNLASKGDVKNGKNYTVLNANIDALNSTKRILFNCFKKKTYKSTGKKYKLVEIYIFRKN